jgi:DNA-binding CsgD family transcriptional regulator
MANFDLQTWDNALDAATDTASLKTISANIAAGTGVPMFCYTELGNRFRRHEYTLFGNFPAPWLASRYRQLPTAEAEDPVVRHVTQGLPPVCWSARGQILGRHEGLSSTRPLLARAGEFGLRVGLTVPLYAPRSSWAFMTFSSGETNDARDLIELLPQMVYLSMLVRYAHDRVRPHAEFKLSLRQYEILTLFSRGHSARIIADHLHVRPRTVYTHVENAAVRLGVPQREVIEAARSLGLIPSR